MVYSSVILVLAWPAILLVSMLLPPTSCRQGILARRRECGPKPGKSQPSVAAALFCDVTGPWHHGLSRAGCFSDGRGTGRRHCSDRLEGRWRRLRPSRGPRGTTAAGARGAPAHCTTAASPGTWTAPPAGSGTQHQPRPPGPTEDGAPLFAPKRTPLAAARWGHAITR